MTIYNDNFHHFLTTNKIQYIPRSVCKDMIVYAPTQVGKTSYIFRKIEESLETGTTLVIMSSCNQTSLQLQTINRFEKYIKTRDMEVNINQTIQSSIKIIMNGLKNNNLVLFTLDNVNQINKMSKQLEAILQKLKRENQTNIENLVIFYDEGDLSLKNDPANIIAQSQKEWKSFIDRMENFKYQINVRRVFVTATPMLLQAYYQIQASNVYTLPIPENYIGYNSLKHIEFNNLKHLYKIIENERKIIDEKNIKNSMIIYSCEREINNHEKALNQYSNEYPDFCITTLNSNGIKFVLPRTKTKQDWDIAYQKARQHKEFKPINIRWRGVIGHTSSQEIDNFYLILAYLNSDYNITIGKNMVNRGISFISRKVNNGPIPIVASTIITLPSKTSHLTNNVQSFGRITGTARHELERRIYCPQKHYETYLQFHEQQNEFIRNCENNPEKDTMYILKEFGLMKIKAKHDRLPVNDKIHYHNKSINSNVKEFIDKWNNEDNDNINAKVFRFIRDNPDGVSQSELEDFIQTTGSINVESQYKEPNKYPYIYYRDSNQITRLTDKAKKYINIAIY